MLKLVNPATSIAEYMKVHHPKECVPANVSEPSSDYHLLPLSDISTLSCEPNKVILFDQRCCPDFLNKLKEEKAWNFFCSAEHTPRYLDLFLGLTDIIKQPKQLIHQESLKKITVKSNKDPFLAEIQECLGQVETFEQFDDYVLTVASEIIDNAIFHAPRDSNNHSPRYQDRDRSLPLKLQSNEFVSLAFGFTEKNFVIQVQDQFGSFSKEVLLKNMARRFQKELKVNTEGPGGKVGLFMALNYTKGFFVHNIIGKSCTITCHLPLTRSLRPYQDLPSAIGYLQA